MSRGFATNLSLAGMTLFLLTTLSSLHPAQDQGVLSFYNEKGKLIFSTATTTSSSKTYVIKTSKTFDEIFPAGDRNNKVKEASISGITPQIASQVEELIGKGKYNEGRVMENVREIFDKPILREMRNVIKDNGEGGISEMNNMEYGGLLSLDGKIIYTTSGKPGIPCDSNSKMVTVTLPSKRGRAEFHSHPSGCKGNMAPWACPDNDTPAGQTCGHTQGVSADDQDAVQGRLGYVFAMRAKIIFIYDQSGIIATLPFSFLDEASPQ